MKPLAHIWHASAQFRGRRRAVAEDDTTFSQEAREPLVSKTNLSGHGFQGPAGSVGGFHSLEEAFGCSRRLPWLAPPAVRPVPSSADRLVCSPYLNHGQGKLVSAVTPVRTPVLVR